MLLHGGRGGWLGLAGSHQPQISPSTAASLEQKIFWWVVKQPVRQKKPQKTKRGERNNNIILKAVGKGGKLGWVVQSCDSQAAPLPCRAKRAQSCSISADSLGSSQPQGCPASQHPLSIPARCLPPWVLPRPAHASALRSSEIEEWELCVRSKVPGAGWHCWAPSCWAHALLSWAPSLLLPSARVFAARVHRSTKIYFPLACP